MKCCSHWVITLVSLKHIQNIFYSIFDINTVSILWTGSWKVFLKLPFNQLTKIRSLNWSFDCNLFQRLKSQAECFETVYALLFHYCFRKNTQYLVLLGTTRKCILEETKTTVSWSIHYNFAFNIKLIHKLGS